MPTWKKRKVEAQCGEYKKCLVTEHYTTDGAFSIRSSGGMKWARLHGARGPRVNRWVWNGYTLLDKRDVPRWDKIEGKSSTITSLKKKATRG